MHFLETAIPALATLLLLATSLGCSQRDFDFEPDSWIRFPASEYRLGSREMENAFRREAVRLGPYSMRATETTVGEYCRYLNACNPVPDYVPSQILREGECFRPAAGATHKPIANISYRDAISFCKWLSAKDGTEVRLPTEQEWEAAARAGVPGGRYPWGWGDPRGRAQYDTNAACMVASFAPNPAGLFDMAGNVFEFCTPTKTNSVCDIPVRGGSWAEKDPRLLLVSRRTFVARDYRGSDVGFRVVKTEANKCKSGQETGKVQGRSSVTPNRNTR